jgi:hypothetical protein
MRPKTPKTGKSGLLKANCARGGPVKYAKHVREINERKRNGGSKPSEEPYRLTLDPIEREVTPALPPPSSAPSSPQKAGTKKDPYAPNSPGKASAPSSPGKPSPSKREPEPAPEPTPVEEKSSEKVAVQAEPSVGEDSYGQDFEDVAEEANGGSGGGGGGGQAGGSLGDGIYDDDDEDFESYTSNQIQQHAANNEEGKASARPGATVHYGSNDGAVRPPSKSSMTPVVSSVNGSSPHTSSKIRANGNGDVSDLEDSVS